VIVGAVAYAGGRLPAIRAKRARVAAYIAFLTLLVISPLILTPINYYSMLPDLRAAIRGYSWLLSAAMASLPELAIALIAFSDRDLIPTARPAELAGVAAGAAARPAKIYACNYPSCEYTTDKQQALAAHVGHHRQKERVTSLASALFIGTKDGEK
jgi:hypothetical protein